MKKRIAILFAALFLALSLVPSLGMLVLGPSGASANEQLASAPRLTKADGSVNLKVLDEATDYVADRFAFRQELVTAWAGLKAGLLHSSAEEKVLLGREGWLFYTETAEDYSGLGLRDAELGRAAENLRLMAEYAEAHGARLLFTVAPNKSSLYPDRMPAGFAWGHERSNAARLPAYLKEKGVPYADLFAAFRRDEVLYYAADSHWTEQGAALAADTLLAALGRESDYFGGAFELSGSHRGDLYEMLYPRGPAAEPRPVYAPGFAFTTEADPKEGEAITIQSHSANGQGSLLCWRDSFGISLYPYLAESFSQALFSRAAEYDLRRIDDCGADTVLIELVERNLPWLLEKPPVLPAPERPLPQAQNAEQSLALRAESLSGGLVRYSGEVPEALLDADSPVYVRTEQGCYQACFAAAEGEQLGFSLCLEEGTSPRQVLVCREKVWTAFPVKDQ